MGRIGKQPITIPSGVNVNMDGQQINVTGPKGNLSFKVRPEVKININEGVINVVANSDSRLARQIHGSTRSIIFNMVKGTTDGWTKILEINGTGYRAAVSGQDLNMNLGFSHPVVVKPPTGITFQVNENKITVSGPDKVIVGEVAAKIKAIKPPDPYKAKGIKYLNEIVRRKAGKAAKAAGGSGGK
jgi:large subunit ribosomal protein L6